jgi:hypothetical protein
MTLLKFLAPATFTSVFAVTAALFAPIAPSAANTVARAEAQCRLTDNGAVIFDGDCSVKQKSDYGSTGFVVKLENGDTYRFNGANNQSLRLGSGDGDGSNVLYEDKGARGVFTWNDGQRTRRLMVKTDGDSGSSASSAAASAPAPANEQAQIDARIESWGRNCKNAIIEKYGNSKMSMADVDVSLGATLKQSIDAGQISLADINKSGLSYNFTARHAKGKDPTGSCDTNGQGMVTNLQAADR